MTFGLYEQDNNLSNGKEPIEWIVLDVQDGKALLLSRYGLDVMPYNTKREEITWENCTLRKWLNGSFLQTAFTEKEQSAILTTAVDNSEAQGYVGWRSISGGNNTQDKIFLLSCKEANQYLEVDYTGQNTESRVRPTAYAVQRGAWISNDYKTAEGRAVGWWWLRSPGDNQGRAAGVNIDGALSSRNADEENACVRPAFWLDLESGGF